MAAVHPPQQDLEKLFEERTRALRGSEALKSAMLDASIDAIITMDHQGRIVECNPAAEKCFGFRRGQAIGKSMAELIVPPELRERHCEGLRRFVATGESRVLGRRLEMPALRADGSRFQVELAIVRVPGSEPPLFTGTLRDITARKRGEQLLRLEHAVILLFGETSDASTAAKATIRAMCENENWECGRYLRVDDSAGVLRFSEAWHVPGAQIERYVESSRSMVYGPGFGLVGLVWQSGRPLWVPDIQNDPRVARGTLARETGMRGAFVFPVRSEGKTIGVFIFQSREIREPDEDLLRTVSVIGSQIGQFAQRAQAEQAMRESEARFRSLTALSSDYYWETDAHHRFKELVFGPHVLPVVPAGAQLGKTRWEVPHVSPDENGWRAHRALLDARLPFSNFELSRTTPGGEARSYSVSGEPMFDETGVFVGYRGVGRETTERSRLEEALAESERRFRSFMNHAPALAWVKDASLRYTYINLPFEREHGRTARELVGRDDYTLFSAEVASAIRSHDEEVRNGSGAVQTMRQIPQPNGAVTHWLTVKFPFADASGASGVAGLAIDVTARVEAEEKARRYGEDVRSLVNRLVQTQEAERRRVADELHDLIGQNLTALGIDLQSLKQRLQSGGDVIAGPRLDAMAALVETTIDAIRGVMTDLRPAALEEFGLVPALRWYASLFSERTGIKVTTQASGRVLRLSRDAELALFRIVQETLTNAAKHSGGTSVQISIRYGDGVRLTVEDDGRGFADAARARSANGGGFGLTTMRERAEAHGGRLRVEFPDRGTRVVVEIPPAAMPNESNAD